MQISGSAGRRVVGYSEEACNSLSPYSNMHPDDIGPTSELHRTFMDRMCPIIVTHRIFNFALNQYVRIQSDCA